MKFVQDQPEWINNIILQVGPYTYTSPERVAALCTSIEYIVRNNIPGNIVECGVGPGGSVMAAILALRHLKAKRDILAFDTFAGMPDAGEHDINYRGERAIDIMAKADDYHSIWCHTSLQTVEENIALVNKTNIHVSFVIGMVENVLHKLLPIDIALLRLDTDWYSSTKCELENLYPNLVVGGVLLIDDYGHWQGARKAVDEYFGNYPMLLHRIDYTGRIGVKV